MYLLYSKIIHGGEVIIMKRNRKVITGISFFICLLIISSEDQALSLSARATGGGNLALYDTGPDEGLVHLGIPGEDFIAEAIHPPKDQIINQCGYAKSSLTTNGVYFESVSAAPAVHPNSSAKLLDYFRVDTKTWQQGAVLDAVMNFGDGRIARSHLLQPNQGRKP